MTESSLVAGKPPVSPFPRVKYSFRSFPVSEKTILYKLTVFKSGKYVLVHRPSNGRHYEEHVARDAQQARMEAEERAFQGLLGGHDPYFFVDSSAA